MGLLAVAAIEFEFRAKVDGGIWAGEVFGQGEGWVGVAVILEFLGDHGGSPLGNGDGWRDEGRCTGLMGWCVGGGAVGGEVAVRRVSVTTKSGIVDDSGR